MLLPSNQTSHSHEKIPYAQKNLTPSKFSVKTYLITLFSKCLTSKQSIRLAICQVSEDEKYDD